MMLYTNKKNPKKNLFFQCQKIVIWLPSSPIRGTAIRVRSMVWIVRLIFNTSANAYAPSVPMSLPETQCDECNGGVDEFRDSAAIRSVLHSRGLWNSVKVLKQNNYVKKLKRQILGSVNIRPLFLEMRGRFCRFLSRSARGEIEVKN